MERYLPQAVAEDWSIDRFAEATKVHPDTASRFLRVKNKEARDEAHRQLFKISANAGAIFHGAAMRQLRRLERLGRIADEDWTPADYQLEKHTMAMVKPLMEWARVPVSEPTATGPPQLADGL
jgi:hypothetical protein